MFVLLLAISYFLNFELGERPICDFMLRPMGFELLFPEDVSDVSILTQQSRLDVTPFSFLNEECYYCPINYGQTIPIHRVHAIP